MCPRHRHRSSSESAKNAAISVLSSVLLFCGFYWNCFHVTDRRLFVSHQRDVEFLVVGRLVKSHSDGILSAGGLPGWVSPGTTPLAYGDQAFDYQYRAYINGLTFDSYKPYESQNGGQALVLSLLDRSVPLSPHARLQFFRMLTSLLLALTLTMVVLWFFREFGSCVAMFVLVSMVVSQWLAILGRNPWWSTWAFYLPMVVVMHFLRHDRPLTNGHVLKFGILVFISVLAKCLLTGYEYITTTLIMMIVPFVYYGILDRLSTRNFMRYTLAAIFSSSVAIFLSLTILCCQIAAVEGNMRAGVDEITYSLQKRTHADPSGFPLVYRDSLGSSTASVVLKYLNSKFFLKVRYWFLTALFLVMSVAVILRGNRYAFASHRKTAALVLATWFSALAPLSWFVIFKAHAFIHTFIDPIVWQMPFTLFGFAVCGLAVRSVLPDSLHLRGLSARRNCTCTSSHTL